MGRKRVEENGEMENMVIDDSMQSIPMTEIPKKVQREEVPASSPSMVSKIEPVNCLRNERIIVRFVPRPTSMVQNPKHILYGGMADTAKRSFVVPRLNSTGMFNKGKDFRKIKLFLISILPYRYYSFHSA